MLLDKMLPVGALNDDIRIEMTWVQQLLGVVIVVTQVELN